ncbi:peptidoglycan/LPS O-acetylase OafA/YrhL [Rhizobium sp. BK529]|uniref:acyltransferase family protein n=1 Tax=unclassified Rhizobium TaxID=2613769 RepID=UPI00104B4E88|nr:MULTISPECIES: acyltransferase [unclassified Rhizobium]MBB3594427.1 peptidoglycan/LPS O-acetylase OafA/YrhL [Rhizobium sp. BK529]TCS02169.1 peptidoglycan/LPS O-acetylase OafA/YrhL [Rhizobium sp. BK418]
MQQQDRVAGADFLRAAACLLVLTHHLILRIDLTKLGEGLRPILTALRFGNFGVAIFFILSGFLLALPFWHALDAGDTMPDLRIYALRRAARIVPGYWVALTAGFIVSITLLGHALTPELTLRYASGLCFMSQWHWRTFFPVEGNGPLWSISFEVTSYVLLPLCFLWLFAIPESRRSPPVTRLAWLGMIVVTLFAHEAFRIFSLPDEIERGWQYGMQGGAKEWMPNYNPIGFFAVFALGALSAGIQTLLPRKRRIWFDIIALTCLAAAGLLLPLSTGGPWDAYGWLGIPYAFPMFPVLTAVALLALSRSVLLAALLDNAFTRFTATISFGIYIWQDIVLTSLQTISPAIFGIGKDDPVRDWLTGCVFATAVTFLLASFSYFLLELPVIRRAARITRSNSAITQYS